MTTFNNLYSQYNKALDRDFINRNFNQKSNIWIRVRCNKTRFSNTPANFDVLKSEIPIKFIITTEINN